MPAYDIKAGFKIILVRQIRSAYAALGSSMISKYKLMRGLLKRRAVRELVWRVVVIANRRKVAAYRSGMHACSSQSLFSESFGAIDGLAAALQSDGATMGPSLPKSTVDYLNDLASSTPCFADRDPAFGFYLSDLSKIEVLLGKKLLLAQYFNIQQDPVVEELSRDPFLLSLAAQYLGAVPKLMGANMWWTFPVEATAEDKSKHAHVFHYDLDDIKFVKFFFYLTDVDGLAGPHSYVKTSNRDIRYRNTFFKSKRFTDEEVVAAYGADKVIEVCGPAGSCLIEDTITLHKGVTPVAQPRLLLQFEFAINTYPEMSCVVDADKQKIAV